MLLAAATIVVTYNSAGEIGACLNALEAHAPDMTLVVVDNASTDTTLEQVLEHPRVRFISNKTNLGFAAAVNQGIRSAPECSHYLILNPDAEILTPLDPLVAAATQHGLSAGRLVGSDGKTQYGFTIRRLPKPLDLVLETLGINRIWPSNPRNRDYRYLDRDLTQPGMAEQPAGAFLMTTKDVWERLGGLDESFYPVWFEDVDYCKRASDSGYQIAYVPTVIAKHTGGHSVSQIPRGCQVTYWYVSLLKYAAKHYRPIHYRGICAAVLLSSVPRAIVGMIETRSVAPAVAYTKVFWVSIRRLLTRQRSGMAIGVS
jgi:N-acetylglucosaminyl-diphospho-decaprenol L-rhamnosyltransferase